MEMRERGGESKEGMGGSLEEEGGREVWGTRDREIDGWNVGQWMGKAMIRIGNGKTLKEGGLGG